MEGEPVPGQTPADGQHPILGQKAIPDVVPMEKEHPQEEWPMRGQDANQEGQNAQVMEGVHRRMCTMMACTRP